MVITEKLQKKSFYHNFFIFFFEIKFKNEYHFITIFFQEKVYETQKNHGIILIIFL